MKLLSKIIKLFKFTWIALLLTSAGLYFSKMDALAGNLFDLGALAAIICLNLDHAWRGLEIKRLKAQIFLKDLD